MYIKKSCFGAFKILPFPNIRLQIPKAHEQLLYALKSEKIKLKTRYEEWAVNKKILNQTYQLKVLLYETLLQVPELKHPLL